MPPEFFFRIRSFVLCVYFLCTCLFWPVFVFVFTVKQTRQTLMPLAKFETATPASDCPQAHVLDRAATEIGIRSPHRRARCKPLYRLSYASPQKHRAR